MSFALPVHHRRGAPILHRDCACGGTCASCRRKKRLQREAAGAAALGPASAAPTTGLAPPEVHRELVRSGEPLPEPVRTSMEARFRHDLSHVRIHADRRAGDSAAAVAANAYTVGRHIVFAAGHYAPHSAEGRQLLAHELTHVLQQVPTPADHGDVTGGRLPIADDSSAEEHEARRTAARLGRGSGRSVGPRLQRQSGLHFRYNEDGSFEIFGQAPGAVKLGAGFRCKGGRCTPVGGWNPGGGGGTYSVEDAKRKLLNFGKGSGGSGAQPGPVGPVGPGPGTGLPPGFQLCLPPKVRDGIDCVTTSEWLRRRGHLAKQGPAVQPPGVQPPGSSQQPAFPGTLGPLTLGLGSASLDGFDFNKAELKPHHHKILKGLALTLKGLLRINPISLVQIVGHTDAPGKPGYNETLGTQRAEAVKVQLVKLGVPEGAILTLSSGEDELRVDTKKKEPKNRRVEIEFVRRTGRFNLPKLKRPSILGPSGGFGGQP